LRSFVLACLVVALARPQTIGGHIRVAAQGVVIVAALDQSSSMTARDFPAPGGGTLSRLDAAKRTFSQFVVNRPDDLIGLVGFANYPDLLCPPTLDHEYVLASTLAMRPARPGDDGTNLGDAIAWSLEALRRTRPKKKVVVLLTDGRNEPAVPRPLDPEGAAEMAHRLGVTLHTIAIGREGGTIRPLEPTTGLEVPAEVEGPDFALLRRLAELGDGRAFVASDTRTLGEVFRTIDELEKSHVRGTIQTRYHEEYGPWVAAALAALVLDRLLALGPLRRLP
jgi:Ca-activated chloride channel family protein